MCTYHEGVSACVCMCLSSSCVFVRHKDVSACMTCLHAWLACRFNGNSSIIVALMDGILLILQGAPAVYVELSEQKWCADRVRSWPCLQ